VAALSGTDAEVKRIEEEDLEMGVGPWASRGRKKTWQARFCVAIAEFRGFPPFARDPAGAGPGYWRRASSLLVHVAAP
jgi:hypothetical protein